VQARGDLTRPASRLADARAVAALDTAVPTDPGSWRAASGTPARRLRP
jgi:hypothetical protein